MAYSDPETESTLLSTLNSDVDRYRNKYHTYEEQVEGKRISISFVSPSVMLYDVYRFYILQNCTKKQLNVKNKYRPDYVSFEEYGSTNWWTLILYINDIPSIEQFDKDEILVPSLDCIFRLEEIASKNRENKTYNEDDKATKVAALLYTCPTDNFNPNDTISQLVTNKSSESLNIESDRFKREEFTLDIPTLRLRYIELQNEPIENSVMLTIKGKPNYTYGKHYILTSGTDNKKIRITWDPNIVSGSGLIFRLKEKDIIQVTYVSK